MNPSTPTVNSYGPTPEPAIKWKRLSRVRHGRQRQSTFLLDAGEQTVVRCVTERLVTSGLDCVGVDPGETENWEITNEAMTTVNQPLRYFFLGA